jgi:hypothetical protein
MFPPELVDAAVLEADVVEKRRRDLPSRLMVYFVLAMWLWREHGYEEVLRQLTEGMVWAGVADGELDVAGSDVPWSGSITKARQRVGPAPLETVFRHVAGPVGAAEMPGGFWRGLRLSAVDVLTLDMPDSRNNRDEFGGPPEGPFPQVRVVAHAEVGTRALIDVTFGAYDTGDQTLMRNLCGSLAPGMLTIFDRGFAGYELWEGLAATGAELLVRMPSTFTLPVTKVLSDGSYLSVLRSRGRPGITVRVVEYTVITTDVDGDGVTREVSELFRLATTLLDPQKAPIEDIPDLYAQRWEAEAVIRAVKTDLRGGIHLRLRSYSPDGVRQEVWALLCVYQALSRLITGSAQDQRVAPGRISVTRARDLDRRPTDWAGGSFLPEH